MSCNKIRDLSILELKKIVFQMLAVVYDAFTRIEKEKFRRLFLHKRKAAQVFEKNKSQAVYRFKR